MGTFVVHGEAGVGPNLAFCLCRKGKSVSAIDGLNRSLGVLDKVGIKNPVVTLGPSRDSKFLQVQIPSDSELGIFARFGSIFSNRRIDPLPDGGENTDVGGDRLPRISQNMNNPSIGKFSLKAENRSRKLRGFGEKNLVGPVEVKMSLQAGAVVLHELLLLPKREVVGKASPPKSADVGKEEVDRFGDEGVDKETRLFFRLGETHLVHAVPPSEAVAFNPREDIRKEMALLLTGLGYGVDKLLDGDTWKNSLIHENGGKGVSVFCE